MCILLGNLLDNAIEAEEKLEGMREINLCIREEKMIYIKIKNRIGPDEVGNTTRTTKENEEFHGFGLQSVNEIVDKYNGIIQIEKCSNYFEVEIFF